MEMEADAVVVGSGAGGGVVAAELARAGRSVVVLEAGPLVDEASMPTDELDAYGRLYLNHGLLSTWDGSVTMLAGAGGRRRDAGQLDDVPAGTDLGPRRLVARPRHRGSDRRHVGRGSPRDRGRRSAVSEATVIPPKDEVILRGAAALGWDAARTRRNAIGLR